MPKKSSKNNQSNSKKPNKKEVNQVNQNENQQNENQIEVNQQENSDKVVLKYEFPRQDGVIRLIVKPFDLRYLSELIDTYSENFPEFYTPLVKKILQDLPKLVELDEDSMEINVDLLSSSVQYSPEKMNCNPLKFNELRKLIDDIIAHASIIPTNEWLMKLAKIDTTIYYNDVFKPSNTFFTFRNDKLLVLKVDQIDFLDAAEMLDKIQAQQHEALKAQSQNRKPKLILRQQWLFETLLPRFPELLSCHPDSPVKIDISKTSSFDPTENPLMPYEINKIIELILRVSGVLPEELTLFH